MSGKTQMKSKKSFGEWIRSRKGQKTLVLIVFMTLPLVLLMVFTYIPFLEMFKFSFYDRTYLKVKDFVGLENYIEVFTRDDLFATLKLSLFYIAGGFVQLALALFFATILCFKTKGSALFKGFLFFPYLINGIAIGFIFKFFFTRGFVFDTVLGWLGFNLENLPYWLKDMSINNFSLAGTSIWRYLGQNMVLFLGAMMAVDQTLYEAAAIDGANAWHKFRYIMLPSIKSVVVLNIILSISGSLSAFEPPYAITNGSFGTATYFVKMNQLAHTNQKVGLASAMAIILFILIFIATMLQKIIMNRLFPTDDDGSRSAKKMNKRAAKQAKAAAKNTAVLTASGNAHDTVKGGAAG